MNWILYGCFSIWLGMCGSIYQAEYSTKEDCQQEKQSLIEQSKSNDESYRVYCRPKEQ